jgi:uncharacterized protein (TIGR00251 family)
MSGGVTLSVRVSPRSSRDAIEGPDAAGDLRVRVTAAPADGDANRAVVRILAAALDVPPSRVVIVSGVAARRKRIRVLGLEPAAIQARWPGASVGGGATR